MYDWPLPRLCAWITASAAQKISRCLKKSRSLLRKGPGFWDSGFRIHRLLPPAFMKHLFLTRPSPFFWRGQYIWSLFLFARSWSTLSLKSHSEWKNMSLHFEFARPPSYLVFDANFLKIDPLSICSLTVLNSLNSNSPLSLRHMCWNDNIGTESLVSEWRTDYQGGGVESLWEHLSTQRSNNEERIGAGLSEGLLVKL